MSNPTLFLICGRCKEASAPGTERCERSHECNKAVGPTKWWEAGISPLGLTAFRPCEKCGGAEESPGYPRGASLVVGIKLYRKMGVLRDDPSGWSTPKDDGGNLILLCPRHS